MPARFAAVIALCAAVLLAGGVSATTAVAETETVVFDTNIVPAVQKRTDIEAIAQFDPVIAGLMLERPTIELVINYRPTFRNWSVHAREHGSTKDLARLVIDDRSKKIIKRWKISEAELPPRLRAEDARHIAGTDRACRDARQEEVGTKKQKVVAHYEDGDHWEVDSWVNNKVVVRCDVNDQGERVTGVWTNHQVAWKMARGSDGAFGGDINRWFVWWPMFALFAALMIRPWNLKSWRTVDVIALLSFGVSHEFFNSGMIEWSVPLAYPPLVYLFIRMSIWFVRGVPAAGDSRGASWVPTWICWVVALFAAGVRYGINAYGSNVVDVGYAGVLGANALLDGQLPYGNMPEDNQHGDTYGPLNYIAYIPAVLALGRSTDWSQGLPAAHGLSVASDVACVAALVFVAWRWISPRAAAITAAAWMTFPYTAFSLSSNVNDLLVAAVLLAAFAALPVPVLRGALLAVAGGIKFVPLIAAPIFLHLGTQARRRQALATLAGIVGVTLLWGGFIAGYPKGLKSFVDATWGFQFERESPFSIWGMYGWHTAQRVAQAALVIAVLIAAAIPRTRDFRQVAAGAAAAVIGVHLVLQHWFYLYIPWFFGFVLIAMIARSESRAEPAAAAQTILLESHGHVAGSQHEPATNSTKGTAQ